MVSHLLYYQLALLAILWLLVMLHITWSAPALTTPAVPAQPTRKRSTEPNPCAGLTHKPHCALCDQETGETAPAPPRRPDPMPPTHRRPRTVDTSRHFCPHTGCDYRGWLGLKNLRANGHPQGGPWRQCHCTACPGDFPEHHGTLLHGQQSAGELIVHVLACLAEGVGMRATARGCEVAPNTVWHWLGEAAAHLTAFARYFLCARHVKQLQLDALYAGLRDVKDGALNADEAIKRLDRSPSGVWTALDPERQLLLVIDVGTRTLEMAQPGGHHVVGVCAPGGVPLCWTAGRKDYGPALLSHFGCWRQPERPPAPGPRPQPRWLPLPQLLYAHVVKS